MRGMVGVLGLCSRGSLCEPPLDCGNGEVQVDAEQVGYIERSNATRNESAI